jgi:ABC-type amino acid transport substrate-binding protein
VPRGDIIGSPTIIAMKAFAVSMTLSLLKSVAAIILLVQDQTAWAGTPVLDRIRTTGVITIAHRESSIPFSYVDDRKQPIGYAVEICQKLAAAVQRRLKLPALKVDYLLATPADRIQVVANGKADLECGSTTNNAERRAQVSFTIPHFFAAARMLVRSGSGIKSIDDLRGKRVISTKGSTPLKLIAAQNEARVLKMTVLEGKDHAESMSFVEKGEADAFVMDDILLYGLRANSSQPSRFEIVGDPLTVEPYGIMISKDDAEYKKIIDTELSKLILDGEVEKLYDKWFLRPIPPKGVVLNAPMSQFLRSSFRFPTDSVGN